MSADAAQVQRPLATGFQPRRAPRLPGSAWLVYGLTTVAAVAAAAAGAAFSHGAIAAEDWLTFAVLAACAGTAQLFTVRIGRNHGFHTAIVFLVAGALLLPPELVALMGLVQHLPEWVKARYPWYIQSFNIANHTVDALAAWATVQLVLGSGAGGIGRTALAGVAAAGVLIVVNHVVLATMLRLARGHSFRASGLFSVVGLGSDLVLAGLGVAVAALWQANPWLLPTLVAPLVLSHRSFSILAMLRESEERFRAMFESAAIGAGLVDLEGRLITSNRALETMLGYDADALRGLGHADLSHPDDLVRELALFRELVAGLRDEYRIEKRYRRSDGGVVWGRLAMSVGHDADGKPRFGIAMIEDITERKRLEDQLRQAQKMEAVGRLAGGVAHDFNNMLTAITGYSELALHRVEAGDASARSDIEEIRRAADRAGALTRQLLAFSRKQILQPKILSLNDVVSDMGTMLRRLIGEHVELETVFGRELGKVEADPSQLEQVIVNLVLNARDAMPDGGRLTIETANADVDEQEAQALGPLQPGPYVTVVVRDTGHGMDTETRAHVFEPFFTTKEAGKGTGLGLATVYGVVKQSGGFIFIESEPGHGAAFTTYLPRVDELARAPHAAPAGPEPSERGTETVLLVEDEDVVRRLLREVLESRGYTVIEAAHGQDAVDLAESHEGPIDLLLTDVVMARMSGRQVADRVLSGRAETRVLYMTGYTDGEIVRQNVLEPGTELLEKPFSFAALSAKVRRVLDAPRAAA